VNAKPRTLGYVW